jgi:hypothetical protein
MLRTLQAQGCVQPLVHSSGDADDWDEREDVDERDSQAVGRAAAPNAWCRHRRRAGQPRCRRRGWLLVAAAAGGGHRRREGSAPREDGEA